MLKGRLPGPVRRLSSHLLKARARLPRGESSQFPLVLQLGHLGESHLHRHHPLQLHLHNPLHHQALVQNVIDQVIQFKVCSVCTLNNKVNLLFDIQTSANKKDKHLMILEHHIGIFNQIID